MSIRPDPQQFTLPCTRRSMQAEAERLATLGIVGEVADESVERGSKDVSRGAKALVFNVARYGDEAPIYIAAGHRRHFVVFEQ
jgi:hypothetical protein